MLKFNQHQFDALAAVSEARFVDQLRRFLESDYPEAAGLDEATGDRNARNLIAQAQRFGITSRGAVLRYVSMLLSYFVHDGAAYEWAHEVSCASDTSEELKLLALEHRLYGVPLWA